MRTLVIGALLVAGLCSEIALLLSISRVQDLKKQNSDLTLQLTALKGAQELKDREQDDFRDGRDPLILRALSEIRTATPGEAPEAVRDYAKAISYWGNLVTHQAYLVPAKYCDKVYTRYSVAVDIQTGKRIGVLGDSVLLHRYRQANGDWAVTAQIMDNISMKQLNQKST